MSLIDDHLFTIKNNGATKVSMGQFVTSNVVICLQNFDNFNYFLIWASISLNL